MSQPPPPAGRRFGRQAARRPLLRGAAQQRPRRPQSPRFGDRANVWLCAAVEAWRPLVYRGADAAFVAAVRTAEAGADAAWQGAASGATAAPGPDLLALRIALRRDGLRGTAAARALGMACAAARRTVGSRPFDSQLIGARALLDGRLAEMATGEGKTLTVALAAAVAALAGVPVHVVTANDYLVARDTDTLRPLYAALGLTVGAVLQGDPPAQRAAAYGCDIACVTAKELVFDHLRDSLLPLSERCLTRGLQMAIVDEADSILIDEARVPLQLSQPVDGAAAAAAVADAEQALRVARRLHAGRDFRLDAGGLSARLRPSGQAALAALAAAAVSPSAPAEPTAARTGRPGGDLWRHPAHREHAVCTALVALHGLQRERHYVVHEGSVLIVDETTGRVAPGRAWGAGLHTLVELKEGCVAQAPLVTVAQSSYPRFFARYPRLAGLSGTLHDARGELLRAYGLAVRRVPLRLPCRRRVLPHRLFESHAALWQAVAGRAAALHGSGRPVLVATDSVADAMALSAVLHARGLPHACLHAGQASGTDPASRAASSERGDAGKAATAADAATTGAAATPADAASTADAASPTCAATAADVASTADAIGPSAAASRAAGEAAIVARAGRRGAITVSTNMAGRGTDIALDDHARSHGGLHVICCQLNGARRIDRQLAGRAARQGDDGSVETWLSLDSALLAGGLLLLPRGPLAGALWARLPSPLVRLLARGAQRREERCQREQRSRLAAHDLLLQRQLGFGGPSSCAADCRKPTVR